MKSKQLFQSESSATNFPDWNNILLMFNLDQLKCTIFLLSDAKFRSCFHRQQIKNSYNSFPHKQAESYPGLDHRALRILSRKWHHFRFTEFCSWALNVYAQLALEKRIAIVATNSICSRRDEIVDIHCHRKALRHCLF